LCTRFGQGSFPPLADDDGLRIQALENAPAVVVQFLSERGIAQEWAAVFGGDDGMDQDLGQ
jgi:inosine/xanthosine triphosphate pyrophosphatase family protein